MAVEQNINIPHLTWLLLVTELRKRGKGRQESGAFLLGKISAARRRIETFVCYDDLDPNALSSGVVLFHGSGFSALWEYCAKKGLQVIADVHTHPTIDVRQSNIDKSHPMIPVPGHIGLIVPRYGRTSKCSLAGVGIHVFQGQGRWKSFSHNDPGAPVSLSLW
jgi:proteasome lid subunit RPN8/RPN11